jgi:hypothetical protein
MEENKKEKVELTGGATPSQIKQWKDVYGADKVKMASLPKDDSGDEYLDVIVRVPDRKTQSEVEKWLDKNPDKAKEIMVNSCLLTHKEEVKADDGLFYGAVDAISNLIVIRKAIIKNL